MPPLDPFLGTDPAGRAARARMLCLIPYLAGGVSLVVAGILNPYGLRVVLISAVAAAFGGTSLLAWYPGIPRTPSAGTPAVSLAIERSWAWIAAGGVVLTFFAVVLRPGLRLDNLERRWSYEPYPQRTGSPLRSTARRERPPEAASM